MSNTKRVTDQDVIHASYDYRKESEDTNIQVAFIKGVKWLAKQKDIKIINTVIKTKEK